MSVRCDARPTRLVVVEHGAVGFGFHVRPDDGEETVVVGQNVDERPTDLALRVVHRIATLERSGGSIGQALILVAPCSDSQTMAARRLIARGLLQRLLANGFGEIGFFACVQPNPELLHLIEQLVGESKRLSQQIRVYLAVTSVRVEKSTEPDSCAEIVSEPASTAEVNEVRFP